VVYRESGLCEWRAQIQLLRRDRVLDPGVKPETTMSTRTKARVRSQGFTYLCL